MVRSSLLVFSTLALLASPAGAQLVGTDTAPGESCSGFPAGAARVTADADQDGKNITLICDGTVWQREQKDQRTLSDADADTSIQVEETADDDTIRMDTAGTERFIIDADGNVGIGTGTPFAALDVNGSIKVGNGAEVCISALRGTIRYNTAIDVIQYCDANDIWVSFASSAGDAVMLSDQTNGDTFVTVQAADGTDTDQITLATSGSERVLIDNNGNVGIGTLAPVATLDIDGFARLAANAPNPPVACSATSSGSVALTGNYEMCVCNGLEWNLVNSATSCIWAVDPCSPSQNPIPGVSCNDGSIYAGLTPDGNVPMFTTPNDSGAFDWNDGDNGWIDTNLANCTDSSPGTASTCETGEFNTQILLTEDSNEDEDFLQPHDAAQHCADLSAHGRSDWYLPAQDELNVLYTNRVAIGNFTTNNYWSSSEHDSNDARNQDFGNGAQGINGSKRDNFRVRCVRK